MSVDYYRTHVIEGIFINLVPYRPDYAATVVQLRNTARARYFLNQADESTLESQLKWYESYRLRTNDIYWVIEDKDGRFIGTTALYEIDVNRHLAEKGRLNVDERLSTGAPYVLEAEILLLDIAFNQLKLSTVLTSVREDNVKMQSINKKLGFIHQGSQMIREVLYHNYSLAKESYRSQKFRSIIEHWRNRSERK